MYVILTRKIHSDDVALYIETSITFSVNSGLYEIIHMCTAVVDESEM